MNNSTQKKESELFISPFIFQTVKDSSTDIENYMLYEPSFVTDVKLISDLFNQRFIIALGRIKKQALPP